MGRREWKKRENADQQKQWGMERRRNNQEPTWKKVRTTAKKHDIMRGKIEGRKDAKKKERRKQNGRKKESQNTKTKEGRTRKEKVKKRMKEIDKVTKGRQETMEKC